MTPILLHLLPMEDAEAAENPREDGYLEDETHGEAEEHEGVDVTLQRNEVFDVGGYLIIPQESEGDGEDDEVTEQDAQHEHDVGRNNERRGIASLVLVEGG